MQCSVVLKPQDASSRKLREDRNTNVGTRYEQTVTNKTKNQVSIVGVTFETVPGREPIYAADHKVITSLPFLKSEILFVDSEIATAVASVAAEIAAAAV